MDDLDLAYAAGFFDGEGSVSIMKSIATKTTSHLRMVVQIGNTNLDVLEYLQIMFGGWIHTRVREGNRKTQYVLLLHSRQAESMLKQIKPYVKVKVKQIDLALDFQDTFIYHHKQLPTEVVEYRGNLRTLLMAENGKYQFW